ncbi:hypothetical protein M501DRAFT_986491 [Patellaria atrata CBS 101060]|uniref:Uncharacterized protein n=1 Tax=Patellaria atrata CBS 101060 TaxID=1346257 RepID=A0A9P4S6Q9_9PEZI|nr:hypothetical protein M501DRAFT_986491 [Patellaria atrata CBS 101060]
MSHPPTNDDNDNKPLDVDSFLPKDKTLLSIRTKLIAIRASHDVLTALVNNISETTPPAEARELQAKLDHEQKRYAEVGEQLRAWKEENVRGDARPEEVRALVSDWKEEGERGRRT